jgi:alkylhydroperoxidase family enzyme
MHRHEETSMARIPYPELTSLAPETQKVLEIAPQNITRMLAGSGELFRPFMGFATAMFNRGVLSPALRELVTCRIGYRYDVAYMLDQHELMARSAGVTEAQMEAIRGPLPAPEFSDHDNAALLLIDAQIDHVRPPEELVIRAYDLLGEPGFHELLLIAGFYHLSARYTEALQIDLDAGKGNAIENMKKMAASEA